nr:unnamed protein product [Spirometra erinaceieuropaei]
MLSIGTPVFVRDYRAGFPDWIEATVVAHRGSMLFDVDVGDDIWVRHHNQIRRRHCSSTTGLESAPSLSLDILLDTFAIPADRSVLEPTAAPPSDIPPTGKGSVDCLEQGNLRLLLPYLPTNLRPLLPLLPHNSLSYIYSLYSNSGKSTSPPSLPTGKSTSTSSVPADPSTPTPPAAAVTTDKNTTVKGSASSVVDLLGGFGNSFLQGVGALFGPGKSTSPPSIPADLNQSTPTPPVLAASSLGGLLGGLGNIFLQGVGAVLGPVTTGSNTKEKGNVTTAKNTTGGGKASSLTDVLGGLGNSLLQGVGGLLGQVSTGGITTGGGSATLLGDFLGGAGSTIFQGVSEVLRQVTTGGTTTGGGNASSLTDVLGGLGNSLLQGVGGLLGQVQGVSEVLRQVTTGGTTTGGGNASSLTDVLGGLGNSLLQGVGGLLGQVSTGGITTGGGSATLLGDFLGGAGSTILQRLNGVLGQGNASVNATIKYNETKIRKPDTKPVVIRISTAYLIECLKGSPFEYAGYIANTTYLLTDIFAHNEGLTAWMKFLRQVVIRLANQVLKTFVGEANWFYKIVNGLFPLTPEYPNGKYSLFFLPMALKNPRDWLVIMPSLNLSTYIS